MAKPEKKSFVLYQNYENLFAVLPMNERGKLITAIFAYERDGSELVTKLSDAARMAFVCIRDALDRDRESYRARCEQNAKNAKLSHKNRQGGSDRMRTVPNGSLNDNDTDNEIDNDNDIDNDNERSDAPPRRANAQQKREGKSRNQPLPPPSASTFDTDDFFQAALARPFHDEPP